MSSILSATFIMVPLPHTPAEITLYGQDTL